MFMAPNEQKLAMLCVKKTGLILLKLCSWFLPKLETSLHATENYIE